MSEPGVQRIWGLRKGPLFMVLSALMITIMVAMTKVARGALSTSEVICWRGFTAVPFAFLVARGAGFHVRRWGILGVRIMLGFGAMFCFFTAIKGLTLADLSILAKLQPIFVALIAPLALGSAERAGWLIWVVLAAGLSGCALLLAPQLEVGSTFGLWAVAGSLFAAGAHTCLRPLGASDNPRTIVFWFQLSVLGLALAVMVLSTGRVLPRAPLAVLPHLLGIGIMSTLGQLFMAYAYAADRAVVVAAASYVSPIWAVLLDLIFFGALLSMSALTGGVLVVGAGLVLLLSTGRRLGISPTITGPEESARF